MDELTVQLLFQKLLSVLQLIMLQNLLCIQDGRKLLIKFMIYIGSKIYPKVFETLLKIAQPVNYLKPGLARFKQNFTQYRKLCGKNCQKAYVFVSINAFTKYIILTYVREEDIKKINMIYSIRVIKKNFSLFGVPSRVIVVQGKCCTIQNIELNFISAGSSRVNQNEKCMF